MVFDNAVRPSPRRIQPFQGPPWAASGILPSGVRNVLVALVRRGHLTLRDALAMEAGATLALDGNVADVPGPDVLRTAEASGLTAYDAEFVVLARSLGVPMVTVDRAILAAAPDVAVRLEGG